QARQRSRGGGYCMGETERAAAAHANTTQRTSSGAPWAVIATDGAYNTLRHLDEADSQLNADDTAEQLGQRLEQCQRWEADDDPHGQSLPRSKRHDDKAIAAIRFDRQ